MLETTADAHTVVVVANGFLLFTCDNNQASTERFEQLKHGGSRSDNLHAQLERDRTRCCGEKEKQQEERKEEIPIYAAAAAQSADIRDRMIPAIRIMRKADWFTRMLHYRGRFVSQRREPRTRLEPFVEARSRKIKYDFASSRARPSRDADVRLSAAEVSPEKNRLTENETLAKLFAPTKRLAEKRA